MERDDFGLLGNGETRVLGAGEHARREEGPLLIFKNFQIQRWFRKNHLWNVSDIYKNDTAHSMMTILEQWSLNVRRK